MCNNIEETNNTIKAMQHSQNLKVLTSLLTSSTIYFSNGLINSFLAFFLQKKSAASLGLKLKPIHQSEPISTIKDYTIKNNTIKEKRAFSFFYFF
jgi:hypothetical protein